MPISEESRLSAKAVWDSMSESARVAVSAIFRWYWDEADYSSGSAPEGVPTSLVSAATVAVGCVLSGTSDEVQFDGRCDNCRAYAEFFFETWGVYPPCDDPYLLDCILCNPAIPCSEPGGGS